MIALQLNNWNESQKLLKKEVQVYQEIHSELLETLMDLEDDVEDIEDSYNASLIVRDMLINRQIEIDTLMLYLPEVFDLEQSNPKTSAFESLKSLGLDILSNDSLRQKITTLYQLSIPLVMQSDAAVENAKFRNKIYPLLEHHLMVNREKTSQKKKAGKFAWSRKFNHINIKDIDHLIEDELLLLTLQKSLSWRWIVISQHQKTIGEINQIRFLINEEIHRLQ
tara:strand:- start:197 stop:865 length:669 start_codon:yes stop_codon:yes gene_type:complete